jgi:hypothetical protein
LRKFLFTLGAAAAFASAFPVVSRADVCSSVAGNLVANCSFETGSFTDWTRSGNLGATGVEPAGFAGYDPLSGSTYFAALGPVGSDGFLSQTLATTPGDTYTISWYLASNGTFTNDFDVEWDGATLFSQTNIPATGPAPYPYVLYTETVTAVGSDTLTFSFRNDPSYLALDDISVAASAPAVPEPGYLGLLSGVLVALPFIRKRKTA